jgi:hypothetical protein
LAADTPLPAAGPEPDAPPQPAPEPAGVRSVKTVYKVFAALVGVATSLTALVFTFAPDLRPSGDAPIQSAKLSELRVNPRATYAQYLARIDQPTAGYNESQLRKRGALLDFRVRIEGFKGRRLLLKWELFDDASGDQVDESKAIQITPTNQTNEATWQFWVPIPRKDRAYMAVVELLEQKKNHQLKLASLETEALRFGG